MKIKKSWNPIVMDHENMIIDVDEIMSPNQLIKQQLVVFDRPAMLMVNGEFWSRKDWDCNLPVGCTCRFVELPRGGGGNSNPLQIILTIVIMVAAIYFGGVAGGGLWGSLVSAGIMIGGSYLLNMLFPTNLNNVGGNTSIDTGGGSTGFSFGSPDSIYSLSSGSNSLRIGSPFTEHFGRLLLYPDLAQVSFVRIEDNDQYLYFLGIIGVGEYAVEGVFIDKTPMLDFSGTQYHIVPPGNYLTLVSDIVWTSPAMTGQDIAPDWLTAVVSAPGTNALYIEYDVMFAGGLCAYNSLGEKISVSVTVVTQVRKIGMTGIALTGWCGLDQQTYTYDSKDPLRFSHKCGAPLGPGRYEFRISRTNTAGDLSAFAPEWRPGDDTAVEVVDGEYRTYIDPISGDTLYIPATSGVEVTVTQVIDNASCVGLRAYGGKHPAYQGITMIEARIKATNQLSGDVARRINVIATRKLYQVTDIGFSQYLEPSRSIVDACAYMVTSANGGMQPDSGLMWDVLSAIKGQLDGLGQWFDWRFVSRLSVMDACSQAAKCGRAVPYMPSGFFCMVRDDYQELPKMVYTDDDFDADSLVTTNSFRTADSSTCMRISYVSPDTWQEEKVVCYDEGGSELTPMDISLSGCSSREHAYAIGMYLYRDDWLNRTTVEFTTGLKGHLPSLFDKIAVTESSADWSSSGKIAAIGEGLIWLSEPVDFKDKLTGKLYISSPDGSNSGPFTVTPTDYAHCVGGVIPDLKTIQDDDVKATSYIFGPTAITPLFIRVMGMQPQGRNKVRIFGTIVNDDVYGEIGSSPENQDQIGDIAPLDYMNIAFLGVQDEKNKFIMTWIGSSTSFKLEIDIGSGFQTVKDLYAYYYFTLYAANSSITVRVTPYVNGILDSDYQITKTYTILSAPAGLTLDSQDNTGIELSWTAISGSTSYYVSIYSNDIKRGARSVTDPAVTITTAEMIGSGGPWPSITVHVAAVISGQMTSDATLVVNFPALAAPTGLTLQSILTSGVMLSWNAVAGATGYKVYMGAITGFDPETQGTLVYTGANPFCLAACSVTTPYDHFFKVAATNDYYFNAGSLVFGAQLEVTG